jgi:hypothetical protein
MDGETGLRWGWDTAREFCSFGVIATDHILVLHSLRKFISSSQATLFVTSTNSCHCL